MKQGQTPGIAYNHRIKGEVATGDEIEPALVELLEVAYTELAPTVLIEEALANADLS